MRSISAIRSAPELGSGMRGLWDIACHLTGTRPRGRRIQRRPFLNPARRATTGYLYWDASAGVSMHAFASPSPRPFWQRLNSFFAFPFQPQPLGYALLLAASSLLTHLFFFLPQALMLLLVELG